jgi:hypothetical protein
MKKMNKNLEDLNGTPEQQIPLDKDQEHLGGTGFTSTFYVKDIIDPAVHPVLTTKGSNCEANNIVFYVEQNNEMMRINPEGFFWKGKLIEEDKEIYLKVKEFFNMPRK